MPYSIKIRTKGSKKTYQIVRSADQKVVGTSDSLRKAQASIKARMANEPKR